MLRTPSALNHVSHIYKSFKNLTFLPFCKGFIQDKVHTHNDIKTNALLYLLLRCIPRQFCGEGSCCNQQTLTTQNGSDFQVYSIYITVHLLFTMYVCPLCLRKPTAHVKNTADFLHCLQKDTSHGKLYNKNTIRVLYYYYIF